VARARGEERDQKSLRHVLFFGMPKAIYAKSLWRFFVVLKVPKNFMIQVFFVANIRDVKNLTTLLTMLNENIRKWEKIHTITEME
jgi:hypothetical protein